MTDLNIILFMCGWGPHAAYQTLQDDAAPIPGEIKMVRIPCAGRITKALLMKSFEMGADGVVLLGCEAGSCRYGSGTTNAQEHVEDTQGILELLGLGRGRLRLGNFLPDEPERLLKFLTQFTKELRQLGRSPISPGREARGKDERDETLAELLSLHDVYACQECGKCSSACPLTLAGKPFSPRRIANAVIAGKMDDPAVKKDIWACLTCGLCYDRCPSAVNFPEFIRDLRGFLMRRSPDRYAAHGGFFHSLMRTMTEADLPINHWDWLDEDIQIDNNSKTLFFGGCAPYFDIFFKKHLGVNTRASLVNSLSLLNFFDVHPALLPGERCCGHDLLWSGDRDNFLKLARLNRDAFHERGIEEIITACPECYTTLKRDYASRGIELDLKVTHLYEFLEQEIDKGAVDFKKLNKRLTFQDPCRLSRLENRPDLPRKLLNRLRPVAFTEMANWGTNAICCGNSAWIGCDAFSKALQVERLEDAHNTGSDILVTACPKCQIHLSCAMEDPFRGDDLKMDLMDLSTVLAKTIQWE